MYTLELIINGKSEIKELIPVKGITVIESVNILKGELNVHGDTPFELRDSRGYLIATSEDFIK
jgi:hypothetical protein